MSYCANCGAALEENAAFCGKCGAQRGSFRNQAVNNNVTYQVMPHNVPKCQCCGYVGPWKVESVIRPMDIILTIVFAFLGIFPGIIYITIVLIIRSNEKNRAKYCRNCNGKNLFTFIY